MSDIINLTANSRSRRRSPSVIEILSDSDNRSPAPKRTRQTPNDIVLTMYEGSAVRQLLPQGHNFVPLCLDANKHGVDGPYVRESLTQNRQQARFAIVARQQNRPVGFVLCTAHSRYENITVPRVVSIDLICTQGPNHVRGLGRVLLQEVAKYAATAVGANVLVLESVVHPRTVRSYLGNGFVRGPHACSTRVVSKLANAFARDAYDTLVRQNPWIDNKPDLMRALNRRYFDLYNAFLNQSAQTVFFSKCLQNLRSRTAGGSRVPSMRNANGFVNFLNPRSYVYRVYRVLSDRLVRLP